MEWPFPLVLIGMLALVAAVFLLMRAARERRRTEAVGTLASTVGFSFTPGSMKPVESGLDPALASLRLFTHGGAPRVRNVMRASGTEGDDVVFDYRYTVFTGNSSHTVEQTVAAFRRRGASIPAFRLSPENVFSKLGHLLGGQDIDFDSNDAFSSQYVLKGDDADAVRRFFERQAVMYFADRPGWSAEGAGEWVILYRSSKRVKPEDLQEWIDDARRAARVLAPR